MTLEDLKKQELPDQPGVYFFMGKNKQTLYIGKATSLKDRVRSYFSAELINTRGQLLVDMIEHAKKIDWRTTDSVLEALLLEASLIKNFQPYYNTKEKDDKSFNYVVITEEDFPRILLIRGRNIMNAFPKEEVKYLFGPFPQGGSIKNALKIIRKIFPFRDTCVPFQGRPCFNRQLGLCPGVCTGEVTKQEYSKTIKHLKLFFEAKKKTLVKDLEKEMKAYAKKREFEKAGQTKRTLFALNHIQDVALIKDEIKNSNTNFRIEAYDIAHTSGANTVGVMVAVEDGEAAKSEYRKFIIKGKQGVDDIAGLKEVLHRRLNHSEWTMPHVIAVDGNVAQKNAAESVLSQMGIFNLHVVAVTKNEKHKPEAIIGDPDLVSLRSKDILLANSEAHRFAITYHRKKRDKVPPRN